MARATRRNSPSGVSFGLPCSSLIRYRFSRITRAFSDRTAASSWTSVERASARPFVPGVSATARAASPGTPAGSRALVTLSPTSWPFPVRLPVGASFFSIFRFTSY